MTIAKKIVSGAALAVMLGAAAVSAQTTTTPGTPDTGVGDTGTLVSMVILGSSAAVAVAGATYLARRRKMLG